MSLFARLPIAVLPEWNDLTNEQRAALVKIAHWFACDDCQFIAGDATVEFYDEIKRQIAQSEIRFVKGDA